MFEGAIAAFLNRLLGRYVEDLDTERLNVGIFSGDTCLLDLKLKPEALYQLGLPIRVEAGLVGKIVFKIPWSALLSQPVVISIEDVFVVAVPALSGQYNADLQKRLIRAEKRKILEDLEGDEAFTASLPSNFFDNILTSVMKNFQIIINNIHIRYEEELSYGNFCACGICIQSISITTTNNKWKPGMCISNSQTLYQLVRAESLSIYLDHDTEPSLQSSPSEWDLASFLVWKSIMLRSLQTFGMKNKEFQFLLKPFTTKIKVILHKGTEMQPLRILVDIVLQDVAMQVAEVQYITFCHLYDSLLQATIARPYRKYKPNGSIKENPSLWWKFAYYSILEYNVKPYSWQNIVKHRENYRKYKELYAESLKRPSDTELKLDMQKCEDSLSIVNIIIAREHAKQELQSKKLEQQYGNGAESKIDSTEHTTIEYNIEEMNSRQNGGKDMKVVFGPLQFPLSVNGPCTNVKSDKTLRSMDYKYNFTLANFSLSLLSKNREVFVITITQFLTSVETAAELLAFKVSARAESFVIEGVSFEGDLVPLVIVNNVLTGNVSTNFLALDFVQTGSDPSFDVSLKLETVEVIYHHYAMMEIMNFFILENPYIQDTVIWMYKFYDYSVLKFSSLAESIASQTLRLTLKVDIGGPYIVFPEHGSIQKEGYIIVVDLGNLSITNEMQANILQLEDATLMELEELLYDRVHIVFNGAQLLCCNSGDDWRSIRKQKDSEHHLLSKVQANVTISYSIKPEYRQLPRVKLNVSVSRLKFNLSESKTQLIIYFLNSVLVLYYWCTDKYQIFITWLTSGVKKKMLIVSMKELKTIKHSIYLPTFDKTNGKLNHIIEEVTINSVPKLVRSVVSSEVSEEDLELLSKTVNLCGFDDNVSPCNHINFLFRFAIGELSIQIGLMHKNRELPYLNLRLQTVYFESAVMEYGFGIQCGVGSLLLVDKTYVGVTGSYLELISTGEFHEVLVLSYRKVRSDCPDFKTCFKSVERSFVVNLVNLSVVFHRLALLKARSYWKKIDRFFYDTTLLDVVKKLCSRVMDREGKVNDPPIPPGAIKLNYSARVGAITIKLHDKESDLMRIEVLGIENDCVYNANERMVLRAHVRSLLVEDLNEDTLYTKILTTDEDKVFDMKYVRHTPKLYVCSDIDTNKDDVMSDGSFKLSIGRINCVLISKIIQDLQHFIAPFTSVLCKRIVIHLKKNCKTYIEQFKRSATKLHIFINIQGPTFLLPQRKDIANLIVFNTGILSIENYFKKIDLDVQLVRTINTFQMTTVDNILLKLKSLTVSRAIMTLTRDLEVQEPIIEPVYMYFDIQRKTEYHTIMEYHTFGLFKIHGSVDSICINLNQRDLQSLVSVWKDNLSKIVRLQNCCTVKQDSDTKEHMPAEEMMKRLEVFLAHNEGNIREINLSLTLEGVQLNLFLDSDEVLSSPVRDLSHGLCKLNFGEIVNTLEFYSNNSFKMKLSVQSIMLQDTRKDSLTVKKIIQSPAKLIGLNLDSCISVSMSPVIDMTYSQASTGNKCFDILVQETRINLSIPFLLHLTRYFMDCFTHEQVEGGIVNHGYDNSWHPPSNDITAGINSSHPTICIKEQSDISMSVRIQKPEILLFGDPKSNNKDIILLQAEVTIEKSRHNYLSSVVYTITNIRAKSISQRSYLKQPPHWLLQPCDAEICRKEELLNRNVEISMSINPVNIHLSVGIMHTFIDILSEVSTFLNNVNLKPESVAVGYDFSVHTDLWSPKNTSNIPYKRIDDELIADMVTKECSNQLIRFHLKPVSIFIQIEVETSTERLPVIQIESTVCSSISDWHNNFQLESKLGIYAFSYDIDHRNWEPLIELCTKNEINYKPWTLTVKMYNGESHTIDSNWNDLWHKEAENTSKRKRNAENYEAECNDMVFIEPEDNVSSDTNKVDLYREYEEDSDTDEDDNLKKFAKITSYLFNNENSEDEDSDSDNSSINEDNVSELTSNQVIEPSSPTTTTPIKMMHSATYIIISSEDELNFTITPNSLKILDMILNAFAEVVDGIPILPKSINSLNLQNCIGHMSRVELLVQEEIAEKSSQRVLISRDFILEDSRASTPASPELDNTADIMSSQWTDNEDRLIDDTESSPNVSSPTNNIFNDESPVHLYKTITSEILHIAIEGFEDVTVYCPQKQDCRFVPLRPVKHNVRYHIVVDSSINKDFRRNICVRSPLQICNETSHTLALYYKKKLAEELQLAHVGEAINPFDDNIRMGIIEPDCVYNVPLYIAYHFPIHVQPAYLDNYHVSDEGIYWRELCNSLNNFKDIYCKSKSTQNHIFCINAASTELPVSVLQSCRVPNYLISILPPLILNNQLPFVLDISIPYISYEVKVEPGDKINVHSLKFIRDIQFHLKIQSYLGTQWTGTTKLNTNMKKKFVLMSTHSESYCNKPFVLHIELCKIRSWHIIVQSQYWIVNKTGLALFIQDCHMNLAYEIPEEELLVFSQRNVKKDKVRLRAHQSEWSAPFLLDGVSLISLIICRDIERGRKYRILVEVQTSKLSPLFTKIITFLPSFLICNKTRRTLRFMEENEEADLWNDLQVGQEVPFWPVTESMRMRVKWKHSQLDSQHFSIIQLGKTVLRMDNGSALCVEIEGGENCPYYITFRKYMLGDAPVRVDNLCDELFLKVNQIHSGQVTLLNPFQSVLYTWDDPSATRQLMWNVYNNKKSEYPAHFQTDGFGQELVSFVTLQCRSDSTSLSGSKSALVKTSSQDKSTSSIENKNHDTEKLSKCEQVRKEDMMVYWVSYMEGPQRVLLFTQYESIFLKAKNIIDAEYSKREVFLSFAGIGLSVVSKKNEITKELVYASVKDSVVQWELCFGRKWKILSLELSAWLENKYLNSYKRIQLDNLIDVDLGKMHITKPFFGKLRRSYSPAIWLHCRQSRAITYLQGFVHKIQVDNQLRDPVFPVVFCWSANRIVANYLDSCKFKHCLEFVLLQQQKLHKTVYKGISVVFRKLTINLEEGLLLSIIDLIPKNTETKHSIATKLRKDVSCIHINSYWKNIERPQHGNRNTSIEFLRISPILVNLKLLANAEGPKIYNSNDLSDYRNVVKYIFEYAEKGSFEKHAEFRLPVYEKRFAAMHCKQFFLKLLRNYIAQIVQQFQVLIQSLTIVGNQNSYSFKCLGESFYNPDSIFLCGEEISEKLSFDVACLLGHATSDSAMTSNMNFVNEYSNQFKEKEMNFQNTDTLSMTFSMKNDFSMEIELILVGLISISTNSVQREELKYFLRTLRKKMSAFFKLESPIAKTCPNITDDIIRRIQEIDCKFTCRVRLPRYISPRTGVELYSSHKAKGICLLESVSKDKGRHNDVYWAHASLSTDAKLVALISLQRIRLLEKLPEWGMWNVKWAIEIDQLLSSPSIVEDKLVLHITKEEASTAILDWYLESKDVDVLEWLCRKINTAMLFNMESSICSKQDV